jgi:riboflavin kinase / FMN adenylyltransferase
VTQLATQPARAYRPSVPAPSSTTNAAPTAITIGNFDGVHLGHAALIHAAREAVGEHGRVVALSFDPPPAAVLFPDRVPPRLTTFEQRTRLLKQLGADDVVRLEPTRELLARSPEDFIEQLVRDDRPTHMVEGRDFRFGAKRAGDVRTLKDLGKRHGFELIVVPDVEQPLSDQTLVTCSSTITRWLIERGRVADAARILGRHYAIEGEVVPGDKRGRTIGYPTANIDTDQLLPADAVYAAVAHLPNDQLRPAAVHVGPRSTFDRMNRTMEAHILDWLGPDASCNEPSFDYHWPITLELVAWLRGQARFASAESLCDQMARDVQRARDIIELLLDSTYPHTHTAGATTP